MDSNHTCLGVIILDFALNKDGNCYLQVFLRECKYIEKKVIRHITDEESNDHSDFFWWKKYFGYLIDD